MKINKAKLLVGTLAIAAVAATVGSISGTVAWFQYSTRVTAAYEGATAHCTENLQIRLYQPAVAEEDDGDHVYDKPGEHAAIPAVSSEWKQDLLSTDITTFLSNANVRGTTAANKLTPVTSGKLAADTVPTKLYKNPIYQYAATSSWGEADATDYIDLPLQFRVLDVNGNSTTETYLAKKIYLSDITFAAKVAAKDISSALRVVVDNGAADATAFKQTFSKDGTAVTVGGNLDLNNDKVIDKVEGYEWDTSRANVKYGDWDGETAEKAYSKASSVKGAAPTDVAVAKDTDPLDIKGKPLFTSSSASDTPANIAAKTDWAGIKLRIYLEGWTTLDSGVFGNATENATPTTVWDEMKVIGDADVVFRLGLRFTAEAHSTH
jgi:hypothetical protein